MIGKSLILLVILVLAGCSEGRPVNTNKQEMKTQCLGGVTYYLFRESQGYNGYGFMSPKYGRDGKVVLCDD